MTVQTLDFIRYSIILPFFLFHISMVIFVAVKMLKDKHSPYHSTFFKLYVMVSLADLMDVIIPFIGMKLLLVNELKPWFQSNLWYNRINFVLSGFAFQNQCILHSAIAINRAWNAFMIYRKVPVLSKCGQTIIWFLPTIPAFILIPRYGANAIYFLGDDNEIHPKYEDPAIQVYTSTSASTVIFITSSISLVLGISTIFRYRYLLRQKTSINQLMLLDIRLFLQALFLFIIQILFALHYIMIIIATANQIPSLQVFALNYYYWINDIFCLSNPIALLIVSRTIRNDYFDFIFQRRRRNEIVHNKIFLTPQTFQK